MELVYIFFGKWRSKLRFKKVGRGVYGIKAPMILRVLYLQCLNDAIFSSHSLDLLREEYEKCEDYWHDKLTEAREIYESDKSAMDEKFQDLLTKIKEYEETFINSSSISNYQPMRLPPIEERANLEQQVTELEDECEGLRRELRSLKVEQDSIISNYQRQWEVSQILMVAYYVSSSAFSRT